MKLPLRYNLNYLRRHPRRSVWLILGLAMAVFLSLAMVATTQSMMETTRQTGSDLNVLVLSRGADSVEFSAVDPPVYQQIRSSEFVEIVDGQPLASPEIVLNTMVELADGHRDRTVVRGVRPVAFDVHYTARMIEGQPPGGNFEIAVGELTAARLGVDDEVLRPGHTLQFEGQTWTISGIFEAPDSTRASEIWTHLDDLSAVSQRDDYSTVLLRARSHEAADDLIFDLAMRTDVRVEPRLESEYFAARADSLRPLTRVTFVMTVLLMFGASLAAMNTMYASLANRRRQMAMLIILGYRRRAVALSFWLESLVVALIGGVVGALAAMLLNGIPINIPMGIFELTVDTWMVIGGLGLAAVVGTAGALYPLWRLFKLRPAEALDS